MRGLGVHKTLCVLGETRTHPVFAETKTNIMLTDPLGLRSRFGGIFWLCMCSALLEGFSPVNKTILRGSGENSLTAGSHLYIMPGTIQTGVDGDKSILIFVLMIIIS